MNGPLDLAMLAQLLGAKRATPPPPATADPNASPTFPAPMNVPGTNAQPPQMGPEQPMSWTQQLQQALIGLPQGTTPAPGVPGQALSSGLLAGSLALSGPGGSRANWGRALLAGVYGARQGAADAQSNYIALQDYYEQRQRDNRYRQALQRELEKETDPDRIVRLESMLHDLHYERPIRSTRGAPAHYRTSLPDPAHPGYGSDAWMGQDGQYERTGPLFKLPAPGSSPVHAADALQEKQKILAARTQISRWMAGTGRPGGMKLDPNNPFMGPNEQQLLRLASSPYEGESDESYRGAMRSIYPEPEKKEDPPAGGGFHPLDAIGGALGKLRDAAGAYTGGEVGPTGDQAVFGAVPPAAPAPKRDDEAEKRWRKKHLGGK